MRSEEKCQGPNLQVAIGRCEEATTGGSRAKIAVIGSESPNRTLRSVL